MPIQDEKYSDKNIPLIESNKSGKIDGNEKLESPVIGKSELRYIAQQGRTQQSRTNLDPELNSLAEKLIYMMDSNEGFQRYISPIAFSASLYKITGSNATQLPTLLNGIFQTALQIAKPERDPETIQQTSQRKSDLIKNLTALKNNYPDSYTLIQNDYALQSAPEMQSAETERKVKRGIIENAVKNLSPDEVYNKVRQLEDRVIENRNSYNDKDYYSITTTLSKIEYTSENWKATVAANSNYQNPNWTKAESLLHNRLLDGLVELKERHPKIYNLLIKK